MEQAYCMQNLRQVGYDAWIYNFPILHSRKLYISLHPIFESPLNSEDCSFNLEVKRKTRNKKLENCEKPSQERQCM